MPTVTGLWCAALPAFDVDEALGQANPDPDLVTVDTNGDDDGMLGGAMGADFVERLVELVARRNHRGRLFI